MFMHWISELQKPKVRTIGNWEKLAETPLMGEFSSWISTNEIQGKKDKKAIEDLKNIISKFEPMEIQVTSIQ